jgi:DNA polymerase I-like protein with 3'-5' exonuclease and polymerase domains
MNIGVLDVETSKKPIMHPWQEGAYLSTVGLFVALDTGEKYYKEWVITHDEWVPGHGTDLMCYFEIQRELDKLDLIAGHNLKFDLNWIKSKNIRVDHLEVWCTQQVQFMLLGQDKSIYGPGPAQNLSNTCLMYDLPVKTDVVKSYWDAGRDTHTIPLRILLPYQKNDVMITAELFKLQYRKLLERPALKTLVGVRNKALHIFSDLELNGMPFDKDLAQENVDKFQAELDSNVSELRSYFGRDDINLESGPELSASLFGGTLKRTEYIPVVYTRNVTLKEPYKFTYKSGKLKGQTVTKYKNRVVRELTCKKGKREYEIDIPGVGFVPAENTTTATEGVWQTNKDVLKNLKCNGKGTTTVQHKRRILELLLHRSKIQQFTSTFVGSKKGTGLFYNIGLNADGYAHPNYNQTAASTGRLSSSNPNGQNFPRSKEDEDGFTNPLKSVFIASRPNGLILVIDLSQLEWRVAAWMAQDSVAMQEIFDGVDIHLDNAIKFFGDPKYRQDAKIMTFRLLYGGSAYAFWIDPKMPDFSKGRWNEIVDGYNRKYRGITGWQERNIRQVPQNKGYLIGPLGRIWKIPQEEHKRYPGTMIYKDTCVKNYPVQGVATADIVPLSMVMLQDRMDLDPHKFMSSNWFGQVHDSMLFDTIPSEVKRLAFTGITVFEELPARISDMWQVDFNLPLTGEAEAGRNYGDMCWSVKHVGGKWITKGALP